MTTTLVRRDSLPEHYPYRDDGCHVSPSCLSCPLAVCILDDPSQLQRAAYEARQAARQPKIKALLVRGFGPGEIAEHLQISRRTVFRELRALRT